MIQSKADRLFEMLKSGKVDLTVNGEPLGKATVSKLGKRDLEVYPPIEYVTFTVCFDDPDSSASAPSP